MMKTVVEFVASWKGSDCITVASRYVIGCCWLILASVDVVILKAG